jgi:hypothetical protein
MVRKSMFGFVAGLSGDSPVVKGDPRAVPDKNRTTKFYISTKVTIFI